MSVAFDLEGTIVDLEQLHHKAHILAARDNGIDLTFERAVSLLPHFIGGPDRAVAAEIASIGPVSGDSESILQSKRVHFNRLLAQQKEILPRAGVVRVLRWLSKLRIPTAIGTVTERAFAERLIDQSGIAAASPTLHLVALEDIERPKPAPDVYIRTAALCGVSESDQIVFEDSPVGVRSAHSAGSRVFALPTVTSAEVFERLRTEGAEDIFDSWQSPRLHDLISQLFGFIEP